ncbi:MAG TPA: NADH-quinone oxidoreductase subunit J, partial [Gammaproteobacteria bacterium]|nr:NADH-quinone oxidoreductase subunit J [Gammaproteobacteria bacterium]
MDFERIVFYVLATILVFAATRVITVRNPVHAALHLVLAFFTCAGLWLLLEAEFLAFTLVLVYVGAVMVLFLFVVMMLDINIATVKEGFIHNLPVGLTVAGLMILELWLVMKSKAFNATQMPEPPAHAADFSNTREIGNVLYTQYVYPFEIAAVILLVAI